MLNKTALKIVATHCGLDVGEDGPTHQCVDYLGLLLNLIGLEIYFPADPNQTDRIIRYVATSRGNVFVGMGRSKLPVVLKEDGTPFFGKDYVFTPGKADLLRAGEAATFITFGSVVPRVLTAWERLKEEGISVAVLNMASLRPLDEEAIISAARRGPILVVEDHVTETGLSALVAKTLALHGVSARLSCRGVSRYGSSGKPDDLYREQGLDAESLTRAMKELLS